MNDPGEIRKIADQKIADAELLLQQNRYDNAIYLAGYSVELYLKAKIAERLGCDDLFLFNKGSFTNNRVSFTNQHGKMVHFTAEESENILADFLKKLKIHDLKQLLEYSGLESEFNKDLSTDLNLKDSWTYITTNQFKWDESRRYNKTKTFNQTEANKFIESVKRNRLWIKNYKP
jgi:HEPN domain-containing protein